MQLAWTMARLNAYAPKKGRDFTKLEKLLVTDAPVKRQTWQEQLAVAYAWTAAVSTR